MNFCKITALALGALFPLLGDATNTRRGGKPGLPYDPKTTSECTWWVDYDGSSDCTAMLENNFVDLSDFRRWNPSIGDDCSGLTSGKSYCVEALFEVPPSMTPTPKPTTSSAKSSSIPTTTPKPTTTKPTTTTLKTTTSKPAGNGVETPSPIQEGLVSNCQTFHFVAKGETCDKIVAQYPITLAQFLSWNPAAGDDCTGLWASTYACVGLIGGSTTKPATTTKPTTTTKATTSAKPTNTAPSPTQPGVISSCKTYDFVKKGDTCEVVAKRNNISVANFIKWNSGVGDDCTSMWAEVYACVGV